MGPNSEGGTALFVQTDVADPASMEHLHRGVQETFGDVDILVNNAAAFTTKPLLEHTVEEWDRIFAAGLRHLIRQARSEYGPSPANRQILPRRHASHDSAHDDLENQDYFANIVADP